MCVSVCECVCECVREINLLYGGGVVGVVRSAVGKKYHLNRTTPTTLSSSHTHTFFLMYKTKLSRDDIIELFILQDGMRVTVAQLPTSYVVHINCQNHLRTMIQKMADPTLSVGGKDDVDCAISELKAKISSFVANSNRDDSCIVVIDCPPDIKNDTLEELQSMLTGRVIFNYCSWILIRPVST